MIANVQHPSEGVQQFEIPFGIFDRDYGDEPVDLGWTPSGDTVYAAGRVIHLQSGTSCDLPNRSVFLNEDVAISVRPRTAGTSVTFYGRNCEEHGRWEVPEIWLMYDASPDRSLISLQRDISAAQIGESLIVDPLGRKVLQRWPSAPGEPWKFAASGEAVCHGGAVLESSRAPATCRDVDTGKAIRESNANGVAPDAMAAHATRVVESDYQRQKILFDYEYRTVYKGRYVWTSAPAGFSQGGIRSQRPIRHSRPGNLSSSDSRLRSPRTASTSPKAGSGKLRLYKIEP